MLILILFWLSHTFSVTLRMQEYVFSVYAVPHYSKKRNLEDTSQSYGINTVVALVSYRAWKCVPQAISGGRNLLK